MGCVVYIDRRVCGALYIKTAYMGRVVYIDGLHGARRMYRQAYMGRVAYIDRPIWGALYI
jgi:hypothetical protein